MRKKQQRGDGGKHTITESEKTKKLLKSTSDIYTPVGSHRLASVSLGALIILIVAIILVSNVLAYFINYKIKISNFTIGNVSISLTEPGWTALEDSDDDGIPNVAEDLKPNQTITKDPIITNDGSLPVFVYMTVKIPKGVWSTSDANKYLLFSYTINSGWTEMEYYYDNTTDYLERTYYYSGTDGVLAPNASTPELFNSVTFANIEPGTLEGTPQQIVVNAYGVQSKGLPTGSDSVTTAVNLLGWTAKTDNVNTLRLIPMVLANLVELGDKVNYNPGTRTLAPTELGVAGATLNSTASTVDLQREWVVIAKEEGKVILAGNAETAAKVTFNGKEGFINLETAINKIAAIYGHGYGAESARGLKVEDMHKYDNFDMTSIHPTENIRSTSTTEKFIPYDGITIPLGATDNGDGTYSPKASAPITAEYIAGTSTTASSYVYSSSSSEFSKIANYGAYWLASKGIELYEGYNSIGYKIRGVSDGTVLGGDIYISTGQSSTSSTLPIIPVVVLQANMKTTGKQGGIWQLEQ